MRLLLHILTRPEEAFVREIITRQESNEENKTVIVDLTQPQPDYKQLLENIFAAETVQVW